MEILIVLNQIEPPTGGIRVVPGAGDAHRPGNDEEIRFTGWLGLLRALYEVTGVAGSGAPPPAPPGIPPRPGEC